MLWGWKSNRRVERSLPLMGIGNPHRQDYQNRGGASHYPSWGSETLRLGVRRLLLLSLITPHGDRKPENAACLRLGDAPDSLPLMGIGNGGIGIVVCGSYALITPHGDRKPLILRTSKETHYPSWGSETDLAAPGAGGSEGSLPLMGIGNLSDMAADSEPGYLITPHGDRKRSVSHCGRWPVSAHYPSWGSETAPDASTRRWYTFLITPHGDRKPGLVRRQHVRQLVSSLPLMGIGNRRGAYRPAMGGGALITPHGDRKPAPGPEQTGRRLASHYPSWGSETRDLSESDLVALLNSLPLMGIGNSIRLRQTDRSIAFSLPLMGIGNRLGPGYGRRGSAALITPHGDRKLVGLGGGLGGQQLSLPLMGIGNLAVGHVGSHSYLDLITPHGDRKLLRIARRPSRGERSLPLMGIGNPERRASRSRSPRRLITPHGDRKRAVRLHHLRGRKDSLPLMGIGNAVDVFADSLNN